MSAPAIRAARPQDRAAVEALFRSSYAEAMAAHYAADVLAAALPAMVDAQDALLRSGRFHIAIGGGRAVGCGGWSLAPPPAGAAAEPACAHVRHFAVAPACARHGIGRALFDRCFGQARAAGVTRFLCLSALNAEPFYTAMGFVVVARKTIPLGGVAFPVVEMRRGV